MKFFVLSFLIAPFIFAFTANAQEQQQINWFKDFKEASRAAADGSKPMLLDFTASWCKPCREMEKDFWTRGEVIDVAKDFVCVKIDLDQNPKLADKYGVAALPNVIMTDSWSFALDFQRGFGRGGVAETLEKMRRVPENFEQIKEANRTLASDKNNLKALSTIAEFYQQKEFYYLSSEFYNRLIKAEKLPARREAAMVILGLNYLKIGWTDEAQAVFEKFQTQFPNSSQTDAILYGKISAYAQRNSLLEAEKFLAELKTKFPQSRFILQAEQNLEKAKTPTK